MPARKLVHPGSNKQDRRLEKKPQERFIDVYEDEPPSTLPQGSVAKAINGICYGNDFMPRNGSILYTPDRLPAIVGRTGYSAHKVDDVIVSDSGPIFNRDDVSNLWAWPNNLYDEMTEYISTTRMRVRDNDPNSGENCFMRGKVNLWEYNKKYEEYVFQLGEDFYIANRALTSFTLVLIISADKPSNSFSEMKEFEEYVIVENSGGQFKIILEDSPPIAYRTNSNIPTIKPDSNNEDGEKNHKYRHFYSMERLDKNGLFRDRNVPVKILTESGLNKYYFTNNSEGEEEGDWSINNTENPIGEGVDTYGVLTGTNGLLINPATWAGIDDQTMRVNINNLGYKNVVMDFTDVTTMDELAAVVQISLRRHFPSATCDYVGEGTYPHLVITSGKVVGGDIAYCLDGVGGTSTIEAFGLSEASGAVISNPALDAPFTLRNFNVPFVGITSDRQWHWTHYVIYKTGDYGPDGTHLKPNGKATVNSPDFIIWSKDLRVAASFIARRWRGVIELQPGEEGGEFEKADEGSVVEFEDGSRYECLLYIDNKHMNYRGYNEYYQDNSPWMAAMIGNGRVARINKTGTIITRYPGSQGTAFTQDDVRKPLWWPNGTYSYIRSVIDADTVEVWDDRSWILTPYGTGVTLDPTYRNYRDIISDEKLFGYSSAWTCKNRFFTPTRAADMISRQPGFLSTAPRFGKEINYMQLELSYRMFVGYHNEDYQRIMLEEQILALEDFPNRYSAICEGSIFTGVTNNAVQLTIPGTLQQIYKLSDPEKVADFGIVDAGSIQRIGAWNDPGFNDKQLKQGMIRFITNIDEIIDFDGINYGPDNAVNVQNGLKKIQKTVRKSYPQFCSIYSRITGYIWWWKN